jgi:hypothetical protein
MEIVCSISAAELSTATVETAIRESGVGSSVDAKSRCRRRRSVNWSIIRKSSVVMEKKVQLE